MTRYFLILEDFAQFTEGQRVAVDNSHTATSLKVVERYIEKGTAKWDDADQKKTKPQAPDSAKPGKRG
jgi:hypothetical protein